MLFRSPAVWAVLGSLVVAKGELSTMAIGGGVAEKWTVLLRMGVEYCPTSSYPLHGLLGVAENRPGVFLQSRPEII